ncbi:MAG: efflux RND transporter periplasmic adaptor subunit [Cycloclasticus sp.]|nr:efflux RND transporter periplasmic adaptor subunit [Cycloclasticus sp.]MBQ0790014.1 efflux RND transporter periplasmic adaptor subunit [Cycloclasticus sp.]
MKNIKNRLLLIVLTGFLFALTVSVYAEGSASSEEPKKGPHGGRLLEDQGFSLELTIFETGVPPEFRVWARNDNQPLNPSEVELTITLIRLADIRDNIQFVAQDDFLRGDSVIYEPHSFIVDINATYQGRAHQWRYDNFEGRTLISNAVASEMAIETSTAGPAVLKETISVYGKLVADPQSVRHIKARFDGLIKKAIVSLGQRVKKGDPLLVVESNESLKSYTIYAPIDGVVQARHANEGEQTDNGNLLSIVNTDSLIAELNIFPNDRQRIKLGDTVWLSIKGVNQAVPARIQQIDTLSQANQSVIVRAQVDNQQGLLIAGGFLTAQIEVADHAVPLAVKRSGLQAFRDFTVVFARVGEVYEVRMLELGRMEGEWAEVLGGLEPGTQYVSKNSYIIKADIEKSGAAHDH